MSGSSICAFSLFYVPSLSPCLLVLLVSASIQVWDYDEGSCYRIGAGHSGSVTRLRISPDQQTIVSVGEEGSIFIWHLPTLAELKQTQPTEATATSTAATSSSSALSSPAGLVAASAVVSNPPPAAPLPAPVTTAPIAAGGAVSAGRRRT